MSKVGSGAKAGIVAGIVYGIISSVFVIIALLAYKNQIIDTINSTLQSQNIAVTITAEQAFNIALYSIPAIEIIAGIIVGLILGIIFAYVEKSLPGSNARVKGIVFGVILWLLLGLLLNLGNLKEYGATYFALSAGGSLIASVIYGFIMGSLFQRWEITEKPPVREPAYPEL